MVNADDAADLLNSLGDGVDPPANATVEPPRRGRGRPRKDGSSAPSAPRRSSGKLTPGAIRDKLALGLRMMNSTIGAFITPEYRPYLLRDMPGQEFDEIMPLSEALAGEIALNPRLLEMFSKAAAVSPHIALISVGFAMIMSRVAIYQQIQAQKSAAGQQAFTPPERPQPVSNDIPPPTPIRFTADDMEIAMPSRG